MVIPPFDLSSQLAALGDELDQAVLDVLRSGRYIGGSVVSGFEQAFAAFCDVATAVGCNSGTDALVLALHALGIGPGDEVITTSFSFFATAEAISRVGARPVFVDVDPATYLIDLDQVEAAITPATRALLPVHLFGRPVDMEHVLAIAGRHGLRVVEDCAQATGASWAGRPVGSWGDLGCFSFFPTKNLGAAGDGGAVTGSDPDLMQRVRELAVHGMPRRYLHTDLGYNSRLDALQDYARDYDELSRIAVIAAGPGDGAGSASGFFIRLAEALGASAAALRQGLPLMPDATLHEEGDAAARIEAARADSAP